MGQWVVTVAGIAILSVLCDVILPEGQTRKYVKTVFGVVVTLVIVQPLIGLFGSNIGWMSLEGDTSGSVQQQYIENVNARQNSNAAESVKILLKSKDIYVQSVTVSDIDKTVTLQLDEAFTKETENILIAVISAYFPDYEILTIWK